MMLPEFLRRIKEADTKESMELVNQHLDLAQQCAKQIKKEWDALQPQRAIIQAMIDARKESGLTQKELSERTGIAQSDISKLERGNANPSLRTLQRLAEGMGMKLKIEFVR